MGVTYVVNGVEVDPNGQPVNKDERAPHSWIPAGTPEELAPSIGEIAAHAAATAPDPDDFDTREEYELARQENEAQAADELLKMRREREGLDPETGRPRQLELPTGEPVGTSEQQPDKSKTQKAENEKPTEPVVTPAPPKAPAKDK